MTSSAVAGGGIVPIGLIQSAIGGSQIEAWTPDTALGLCKEEQLNADGQWQYLHRRWRDSIDGKHLHAFPLAAIYTDNCASQI